MANKKISELPSIDTLTGSETFEIVQGGVNKKGELSDLSTYIIGQIAPTDIASATQRYNFDVSGSVSGDYSTNFGSDTDINSAWSFSAAESTVHAAGANNSASFGWDHLVGDGSSSGSGANSFTAGVDLINYANAGFVSGHRGRLTYVASTTGGFVHGLGVGYPSTIPYVTAIAGAINISRNTVAQTDGFGALAQDSFIIGGINGNIPSTSPRSGKLGGGIYNFPASTPDYIAMPNIIIFGTPDADNTLTTSVLALDSISKKVKTLTIPPKVIQLAVSDETTALTTGTGKITFRMPYAMTLTAVRASLTTAQTSGSILTVDINEGGSTILSTKLTIDNTEKTSTTAAAPPVISDASLSDDAEITIDIDQVGDGTAKGLKITLIGI